MFTRIMSTGRVESFGNNARHVRAAQLLEAKVLRTSSLRVAAPGMSVSRSARAAMLNGRDGSNLYPREAPVLTYRALPKFPISGPFARSPPYRSLRRL